MGQVIAINTAVKTQKSETLIAKLCVAAYKQFDKVMENFQNLQELCTPHELDTSFEIVLSQYRILYRVIIHFNQFYLQFFRLSHYKILL